ncbi:DUF4332 domain-containing protein [[Phormidium] sp. ETS-05]|uniref:DUF4332 domain-containing protein n=1 Tax=[Phormidium] sp. ETS-05 TaxID=222819 RepID=UPI001E4F239F|nr:DUF4332 domain-containing protein [[Phormidium] sp. ETS-05]
MKTDRQQQRSGSPKMVLAPLQSTGERQETETGRRRDGGASFKTARTPIFLEWPLEQLPGLSAEDGEGLGKCGLITTTQLRQQAATKKEQQLLAERLRVRVESVQKWVALAELSSVPSVGCEYCGLLLHAGVASVGQLAQMPLHRLHQQILRVQVTMMQRRDLCPGVELVGRWIAEAKLLATHAR